MKTRYVLAVPIFVALITLGFIAAYQHPAAAQDGSNTKPDYRERYSEPAHVEGGEADWSVTDVVFTSNYPDGFTFTGKATSSAGELSSVSVFFSHNQLWEEDTRIRGEVDAATGEITVVVEGLDADDIPPWVPVNFQWRISDSAGTVYWSEWYVDNEYADNTSQWERYESDDVLIFVEDGFPTEAVNLSIDAMARERPLYEAAFGRLLAYKPRMMLFASEESFDKWRGFDYASGTRVVGQSSAVWGAFVQFLYGSDFYELAYGTVVHEIAHLYQFDLYDMRGPGWWIEGNATYFEQEQSYDYEQRVRDLVKINALPRLFDGTGGPIPASPGVDGRGRLGYDVGYTFNKWLIDTYGVETHLELITKLGEPDNVPAYQVLDFFDETLEDVTGKPVLELEGEWRAWLGASAAVPTLIPTPTFAIPFQPTQTPFGQ